VNYLFGFINEQYFGVERSGKWKRYLLENIGFGHYYLIVYVALRIGMEQASLFMLVVGLSASNVFMRLESKIGRISTSLHPPRLALRTVRLVAHRWNPICCCYSGVASGPALFNCTQSRGKLCLLSSSCILNLQTPSDVVRKYRAGLRLFFLRLIELTLWMSESNVEGFLQVSS
jgi:hypothetical protein